MTKDIIETTRCGICLSKTDWVWSGFSEALWRICKNKKCKQHEPKLEMFTWVEFRIIPKELKEHFEKRNKGVKNNEVKVL